MQFVRTFYRFFILLFSLICKKISIFCFIMKNAQIPRNIGICKKKILHTLSGRTLLVDLKMLFPGIVLLILYYCYSIPAEERQSILRTRRRRRGSRLRLKDLPPSYESIHFSELPPHYEVLF